MITQYGFTFGPLEVVRIAATPTWGYAIDLVTPKQRLEIRVTPKGFLRVGKVVRNRAAPAKKRGRL